jgi:aspartyl-tRNA(Asn)/glutamyl-tRNA(Gln) amidotransferase subunit B
MSATPAGWEVVIGLETHTQLSTASKIFSGSATTFGAAPNTQANVVDLALPGTLPVMNRGAVEKAIMFGLAVNGTIAPHSVFARKNYFYPDLPKGYQISQFELPVVVGGKVQIVLDGVEKTVQLTRAHLEEDAGKSLHEGLETMGVSGIDLNRAGTPLLEIVTEPDMRSAAEAVAYAKALHGLVTWLGICDGNMQEGSFRCDANVSVRPKEQKAYGTRCEIKNVNSFKFLERAIEYEIRRQIELIEDGGRVVQETRLYDADRDETRSMRSKEDAMDYRYFPDPDLLPLVIDAAWIERVKSEMPELPAVMSERFTSEYQLSSYDARLLTASKATANYFASMVATGVSAKTVTKWINGEIANFLNREGIAIDDPRMPGKFVMMRLMESIERGETNFESARNDFRRWCDDLDQQLIKLGEAIGREIDREIDREIEPSEWQRYLDQNGLRSVSDANVIEKIVDEVIAANQKSADEFKSGKEKAFQALVGQVMKASKGKANPSQVNEILKKKLSS